VGYDRAVLSFKNSFVLTALLSLAMPAMAVGSITLDDGTEIQADTTITSQWRDGTSGGVNEYTGAFDYRVETKTPFYERGDHEGSIIMRVSGLALIDDQIGDFFDDELIDINELFLRDDYAGESNDYYFVAGKFATRRFFDKDEITPDTFDIGERRFAGAIENTNNLLNFMNEFRDVNDSLAGRDAKGSYGFSFGVKDRDGDTFADRWGFRQALSVAELGHFGNTFYGVSEINKNWGEADSDDLFDAGQFDLGLVYGGNGAYRLPNTSNTSYTLYTSFVQQIDKWAPYVRWGTLFGQTGGSSDFSVNEFRFGVTYSLDDKNTLATHLSYFDGAEFAVDDTFIWINTYRHRFSDQVSGWLFMTQNFNQYNPNATGSYDNSWSSGAHVSLNL